MSTKLAEGAHTFGLAPVSWSPKAIRAWRTASHSLYSASKTMLAHLCPGRPAVDDDTTDDATAPLVLRNEWLGTTGALVDLERPLGVADMADDGGDAPLPCLPS